MSDVANYIPDNDDEAGGDEDYRAGSVEGGSASGEGDDLPGVGPDAPEGAVEQPPAEPARESKNPSAQVVINTGDPEGDGTGGDDVDAASG